MTIWFRCPDCDKRHQVKDEMAGKKAQCKCGTVIRIPSAPDRPPAAPPAAPPSNSGTSTIAVPCSGCGLVHQVHHSRAGTAARCRCGTVVRIPDPRVTSTMASLFDELTEADYRPLGTDIQPDSVEPVKPRRSENEVLRQYLGSRGLDNSSPGSRDYDGAFGWEKRGLDMGMVGGMIMMVIAIAWFVGGLAFGLIFPYTLILFVIGLFGFLRGLFTGNVSGDR